MDLYNLYRAGWLVIYFGLLFWSTGLFLSVMWAVPKGIRYLRRLPRRWRENLFEKRMFRYACEHNPLFVMNEVKGVTAITLYSAFVEALDAYRYIQDNLSEPGMVAKYKTTRPQVWVDQTFTFSKRKDLVPAFTGTDYELRNILAEVAFKITKISANQISRETFDNAFRYIVERDSRLNVPFVMSFNTGMNLEEQVEKFGNGPARHKLEEARLVLRVGL